MKPFYLFLLAACMIGAGGASASETTSTSAAKPRYLLVNAQRYTLAYNLAPLILSPSDKTQTRELIATTVMPSMEQELVQTPLDRCVIETAGFRDFMIDALAKTYAPEKYRGHLAYMWAERYSASQLAQFQSLANNPGYQKYIQLSAEDRIRPDSESKDIAALREDEILTEGDMRGIDAIKADDAFYDFYAQVTTDLQAVTEKLFVQGRPEFQSALKNFSQQHQADADRCLQLQKV